MEKNIVSERKARVFPQKYNGFLFLSHSFRLRNILQLNFIRYESGKYKGVFYF